MTPHAQEKFAPVTLWVQRPTIGAFDVSDWDLIATWATNGRSEYIERVVSGVRFVWLCACRPNNEGGPFRIALSVEKDSLSMIGDTEDLVRRAVNDFEPLSHEVSDRLLAAL